MVDVTFFGRINSLTETFGPFVLFLIIVSALSIAAITLWRGIGIILFLLFVSYSVGAIANGGVIFLATVVRWACLVLLALGIFKNLVLPQLTIIPFVLYSILSFVFIVRTPAPMWSLQLSALLLITVFSIVFSIPGYVKNIEKIETIFKFGIFAAGVWALTSMIFVQDFLRASDTSRFSAGEESAVVGMAWAGAFFAPMLMWGVLQRKQIMWRVISLLVFAPYAFVLILGSVRTAIFGMIFIPIMPILFLKQKNIRMIISITVLIIPMFLGVYILSTIAPDKFFFLTTRLTRLSTSGRVEIWQDAFKLCMNRSMFMGMGTGSSDIASLEIGYLFHNAYLAIWYNAGLIGLLLVLSFLGTYLIKAFRLVYACTDERNVLLSKILFGYMLGLTAIGMFESAFSGSGGIAVTMLLLIASLVDRMKVLTSNTYMSPDTLAYTDTPQNELC